MKQLVTLTLENELVACLDRVATEAKQSRSAAAELIISDYLKQQAPVGSSERWTRALSLTRR